MWGTIALFLALILLWMDTASAEAGVTHEVEGEVLTVTGDGAANAIALSVRDGEIAVDGVRTGLAANRDARIVVDALAGTDEIDAGALLADDYAALAVTGGPDADLLAGGGGSDLLIWNEGDGSDVAQGDGGNDGVLVNGSPGADVFSFRPDLGSLGVVLARTAPAPFTIELEAERMVLNGLGGNDVIAPDPGAPAGITARTEPIIDGGEGEDEITGGDGTDELHGGADADVLSPGRGFFNVVFGEGGADRLEGDEGEDFLFGGKGDDVVGGGDGSDTVAWIDGDGNDTVDGGAGLDSLEVDGGDAAETFTYERNAAEPRRFLFRGVDPVPFAIDFDVESLSIRGLAGDDVIRPSSPTGLETSVEGGLGDDKITGGESADMLQGGPGNDSLFSRDGVADIVRGGPDLDGAQTDPPTLDQVSGVEVVLMPEAPTVDPLPPSPPPPVQPPSQLKPPTLPAVDDVALLPKLGKVAIAKSGKRLALKVPVSCPAEESGGCRTTLTVKAARGGSPVTLGSKTIRLVAEGRARASIPVPRITALARNGRLPLRIRIVSTDAAGNTAARTVAVMLRLPR